METTNQNLNQKYSYADYLTWIDDIRRALFNGIIKIMTPVLSNRHRFKGGFYRLIENFISGIWSYGSSDTIVSKFFAINFQIPKFPNF